MTGRGGGGAFFGPLPKNGIWNAFDLTRNQFAAILLVSIALFLFIGGPLWSHAHESHFWRIGLSYLFIPVAVLGALYRNGKAHPITLVVASAVLSLLKLVATALILIAFGVAGA